MFKKQNVFCLGAYIRLITGRYLCFHASEIQHGTSCIFKYVYIIRKYNEFLNHIKIEMQGACCEYDFIMPMGSIYVYFVIKMTVP